MSTVLLLILYTEKQFSGARVWIPKGLNRKSEKDLKVRDTTYIIE